MSDEQPTNTDIISALHQHDVRLVRLEGKVDAIDRDVAQQAGRMDKAADRLEFFGERLAELTASVAGLKGSQRIILLIVATLLPAIAALELWDRLFLR